MPKAMLATLLILSFLSGLAPWETALGSVRHPETIPAVQATLQPERTGKGSLAELVQHNGRRVSSSYSRLKQEVFAKLRPVDRQDDIDFDHAQKVLNSRLTWKQQVLKGDEFEKKMRKEYVERVAPFESNATNPIWRPRSYEVERYEKGRKDLAQWTRTEVLDDQLQDLIRGGDKDSAPIQVLETAQKLSGGTDLIPSAEALTPEQRAARAHRKDLPPLQPEEEKIPTKLRTKVNVVKGNGSLVFTNPVATTSLKGDKEDVSLEMNKEFRKLTLKSTATYGVKQECLNVNLNKRITDKISLDLDHSAYTGGKSGPSGEKTREQAKVNYTLSF
ncbi:MAG TPA: hypothetical protein VIH99_05560 [Bdellovibrionota bacterium]|jgi:hypothetical protein